MVFVPLSPNMVTFWGMGRKSEFWGTQSARNTFLDHATPQLWRLNPAHGPGPGQLMGGPQ